MQSSWCHNAMDENEKKVPKVMDTILFNVSEVIASENGSHLRQDPDATVVTISLPWF